MSTLAHRFGKKWTRDKLNCLKDYLKAYSDIFNKNPKAQYYNTFYVDAFAGTGYRVDSGKEEEETTLFSDLAESEPEDYRKGSAAIALGVNPGFKNYLFIEKRTDYAGELEKLKTDYSDKADKINIIQGDANQELLDWVRRMNWRKTRAVVFLDPYGMQVEWKVIEALGNSKGVDLWLLFPLGTGVMRLLTKKQPPASWARRLTLIFGTDSWEKEFYKTDKQMGLFDNETAVVRNASFENIGKFLIRRLQEVFYKVYEKPMPLMNSRNNPLYLFCFAVGNEVAAKSAMNIASYLIEKKYGR